MTIKAAVHGLGNIGRHVIDCLTCASDFECLGVIRRESSLGTQALERRGIPDFASIDALIAEKGKPDVVVLCGPSRSVPDDARFYLSRGIRTVDSFDVHSDIPELVKSLDDVARQNNTGCITAAGWDPGTDSVMRTLFEAMAPVGTTFTNFGRGRSMGTLLLPARFPVLPMRHPSLFRSEGDVIHVWFTFYRNRMHHSNKSRKIWHQTPISATTRLKSVKSKPLKKWPQSQTIRMAFLWKESVHPAAHQTSIWSSI